MEDEKIFSKENIHKQLKTAKFQNGFFTLKFYVEKNHKPSRTATNKIEEFYLYPSGGTLRDSDFNIVFYDSQFDTYRGFEIKK